MSHSGNGNRILDGLNPQELEILQPHLQQTTLRRGVVLCDAGEAARYLYFPSTSVLCLVGTTESGASVEVALVGREGVASVAAALGRSRLPFRVVVQMEGTASKIATDVVTRQLRNCRELHGRLLLYSHNVIAQLAQSAICNRFHTSKQRLARWLLTTADRVESRELPLTHEFIAHMVGGPRSAVTEAAAALRASGAIDYRRGRISIKNEPQLLQESCECYRVVQDVLRK
jgi:CRP-like cAMP-binding protein